MGHQSKGDLLQLLSSFAEEYITKIDIAKSDWPSSFSLLKEKQKCGFNLMLQVISVAYSDLLEEHYDKKLQNQVYLTVF